MADGKENDPNSSRMRVVVRVRPMSKKEIDTDQEKILELDDKALVFDPEIEDSDAYLQGFKKVARLGEKKNRKHRPRRNATYCFDAVFGEDSTQEEVYDQTTADTIPTIVEGFNATVFAYGATGAGKTHTMLGTPDNPGVIGRTVSSLFKKIDQLREANGDTKYKISVNYLEVYNERINDLLINNGSKKGKDLPMRDIAGAINIGGLSEREPKSDVQLMEWLTEGNQLRTQHPTEANAQSSRSHAVFVVHLHQTQGSQRTLSKLTLVDLAGSERATATSNGGARLREGGNINKSLLALGNVINALADPKHKGHINYRDSKLTRILKDGLGGSCRTIMIANVSPADKVYEDTLNTIKYADRAKSIRSSLTKRILETQMHVGNYKKIIEDLKNRNKTLLAENHKLKAAGPSRPTSGTFVENPMWTTLIKLQSEIIRLSGDEKIAMCEKQLKIYDFELKKAALDAQGHVRSPGSNRFERVSSAFDMKASRISEKIVEHEKQINNTRPSEKPGPVVKFQLAAELNHQKMCAYQKLCGKLFTTVRQQHSRALKLAYCSDSENITDILCPQKNLVAFNEDVESSDQTPVEVLPEFLKINSKLSFDDFVPIQPLSKTRRGLAKQFDSVSKSTSRPMSSMSSRSLAKSKSDPSMTPTTPSNVNDKRSEKAMSVDFKRKRAVTNKENKSPVNRVIPLARKRSADATSKDTPPKKSKSDAPENVSDKPVPSYMRPTASTNRQQRIQARSRARRMEANKSRLEQLKKVT